MAKRKAATASGSRLGAVVFRGTAGGATEACASRFHNCAGLLYMLDVARRTGLTPDWDRILIGWEGPRAPLLGSRTADAKVVMEGLVGKIPGLAVRHEEGPDGGTFEVRSRSLLSEAAARLLSDLRARVEAVLDAQKEERKRKSRDAELTRMSGILAHGEPTWSDGPEVRRGVEAMVRTLLLRLGTQPRDKKPFPPTKDWVALRVYAMAMRQLIDRGLPQWEYYYLKAIEPKADSRSG